MLRSPQHPQAGSLGDLEAAAQVRRVRKRNNLERSGGDVINRAVERSRPIARQQDAGDTEEGGRAKDGPDVVRVLQLIEGQPKPMARAPPAGVLGDAVLSAVVRDTVVLSAVGLRALDRKSVV